MSTGYFAQITYGVVTDVRKTTREYIAANPDLYLGLWVEVQDMDQYPAIGWTLTLEGGFEAPVEVPTFEDGLAPPPE
jgi:hypothetical protein